MEDNHASRGKVLVGLGNPGRQYRDNRHNVGWMALDRVADIRGVHAEQERYEAMTARCGNLLLLKPLTYMNRSGRSVSRALKVEQIDLSNLLVIMDDVDLAVGSVRLRDSGSSGGHRGLESVIQQVGTEQVARLRLGVGPCPSYMSTSDFVLSDFSEDETEELDEMLERAARAALCWAEEGAEAAMNQHNYTAPS